jgi:hypothetical protein
MASICAFQPARMLSRCESRWYNIPIRTTAVPARKIRK